MGSLPELGEALGREGLLAHHRSEDDVAALARALGVADGAVERSRLQHRHEHGGLLHLELGGGLVEVRLRGGLDAEGVVPPRHRVEVHLEDLVLRVAPLDLDGREDLPDLPDGRALEANLLVEVARELHRDGGGPAEAVARDGVGGDGEEPPRMSTPQWS
jgi:hypothetical protein